MNRSKICPPFDILYKGIYGKKHLIFLTAHRLLAVWELKQVNEKGDIMRRLLLILAVFFLSASATYGAPNLAILKGEAMDRNHARLILSVTDEAGRPIKGLIKDNFSIQIEGKNIQNFTVQPVSALSSPLTLLLAVDVSGSMKGEPFQRTKEAVSDFLDQLDREDKVGLMTFGTNVRILTVFLPGSERHIIREKLDLLWPSEKWTHLCEAIYKALEWIEKKAPTSRRAFILLTDGKDEGSNQFKEKSVDMARGLSVPVFAIGFGRSIDRSYLAEIARISGGRFLFAPNASNIASLYDSILEELKNQYLIRFPFRKEPAVYTAKVSLKYEGSNVEANKKFLFNPSQAPIIIENTKVRNEMMPNGDKTQATQWYEQYKWVLLAAMALVFVGLFATWNKLRKKGRENQNSLENRIRQFVNTARCEIEFPKEKHMSMTLLETWAEEAITDSDETRINTSPDVFLKVDCLASPYLPLVYGDTKFIEELIIARPSEEGRQVIKSSSVYLWANHDNISRPGEVGGKMRHGHARIFMTEGGSFAVEDLGSTNGTYLQGVDISGQGAALLQDGDVIEFGGKSGMRVVYLERREKDFSDYDGLTWIED